MLLADTYQKGRVFLAGDAVHLVVPFGGLGMNTGIGDAIDLSWKLSATLAGWGGTELLKSYTHERRQIGEHNLSAARSALVGRRKWRSMYSRHLSGAGDHREGALQQLREVAEVEQRKSNDMIGAELGYRYIDSKINWNVPGGPEVRYREYKATSWPGSRIPHVWLRDGSALQDRLGMWFSVLSFSKTPEAEAIVVAFEATGAPVVHIALDGDTQARSLLEADLLVVRPDLHVAWRGNQLSRSPEGLVSRVIGQRSAASTLALQHVAA
jgi:hypothetical protein